MLLADDGPDWLHAFICMSNTMSHMPLSDNGHIGTMMDGVCTVNACGQLHQLQVWKLLQHSNSVVFSEGLYREPKALQFSFQELSLWNAASADEPTQDPPMIEVVLSSVGSKTSSPTQVALPFLAAKPWQDITTVLNLHLQGLLNSCSRHLLQSQPLPLSMSCLEGSHHLWPWVLCPPLE